MEVFIAPIASGVVSALLAAVGVYVSNSQIKGNDRNDDNGNVSVMNNVKMSNNFWVLRAVYGV